MAKLDEIINDTPELNYDPETAMSERFQQAQKSVDWGNHPLFNLTDADKVSNEPVNRVYGAEDLENITSGVGTIAWDAFRKGVLDLSSVGSKAQMALGNTLAGVTGDRVGTEMRNRAADQLMKTMEDSRFIDSNYGDAETWTERFVGGAMSMGEMLAVGALTGPVGLGAYVGTLSLSDGALNDMVKYQEENGTLDGYETDSLNLALDYGNAVFQVASELMLGTGRLVNGKFLKAGKTASAIAKETLDNFIQESAQGAVADVTEVLKGNKDISVLSENVAGYIKDGVVAGVLGGAIGGSAYKLNKNRALAGLDKINKQLHPEMTDVQIRKESEDIFEKTEEKMEKSFIPELVARQEATNDKGKIRENVRQKVEMMYRDNEDMTEKQKAKAIEATTTLELENMLYDSIEKKIPLTAHPLLQGEVNELGWFRDGIPENRRAEINALNDEIKELKAQRTQAMESKDYTKLDELDTKIEEFRKNLPEKIKDLVIADREEIKNMLEEQRKAVENSQAKKRLFAKVKDMARKAAEKQGKAEVKLAEQMATGAEKARAKREQAETALQTKEAKIRTLTEQRQIASSIKRLKNKVESAKTEKQREFNYAVEQATDESLRQALLNRDWNEYTVKHMKRRQLKREVKALKNISAAELTPMTTREITTEQQREETKQEKAKTAKGFFHKKINRDFANESGILQAWGYSKDDSAVNLVFVKDGGYKDWDEIVMALQESGYLPETYADTYEKTDALVDQAKDIVLNNKDLTIETAEQAQIDYTEDVGYKMLKDSGLSDADIQGMSYQQMSDKLTELYREQQPQIEEPEINVEEIPDMLQSKVSSKGISEKSDKDRGYYNPEYRFIAMTENMDASTLAHELAHDWGQEYFRWARSGKASESFMRSWGAVEKAIGITDKDTYFTYDASEKFARAYEGWLMERKDWADILHIDNDEEKKAVEDAMEDYRKELVDIYDSLTNPYFTMAWGKVGELKPELKQWFERSTKFESLDEQVRRGEITAEQASEEKLKDMMETATNNTVQNMSAEDKQAVRTIENLEKLETQTKETANRFDTEGGNRNAIQARLNQIALAKDLTANDAVLERYDTHRDMLEVAKAADEFVRTRQEDAIKIINGEMAEQDGLYASDLYTALERVAKQTGDFELIDELRHSRVATELAKELGQRVAGFRNYTGDGDLDIVSALKKVDKIYDKAYNETEKDNLSADLKAWAEDLQATDSLSDAKLDEFFKDMECQ